MNKIEIKYDDTIVKNFALATVIWAGVALLLGVYAALELASHHFNLGLQWITFGRLRPLHTNAAIFAFGGNAIFAGIYHSTQRLLKTRMFSDLLSRIHFWGWQLIIVSAALTLPLGLSHGKEYAELEWPIDILIAVVWVLFGVNIFGTIKKRRERHLYVAIWFYIATIVTIALLHIVNSIEIPVSFFKSYPIYAGVQDALVQWWYGHNAVAFFLTTPFLGLMYYYIPKISGRPVYSYRLSVIHFWTLVFLYIWAGPHHLLYTALPEWAQTLGVVFSVMLWIPSWGAMVNGLMTLQGIWGRVREEAPLKFLAAATVFYGMATFEGPLLSIKSVSGLAHYTDWIIGHVHSGALGWNGFLAFGMLYYLIPKLYNTKLAKPNWAHTHFWLATLGIVLYMVSMWIAGITQGLMLQQIDGATGKLVYPDFVETVSSIIPLYWIRAVGGLLYLTGYVIFAINIKLTISQSQGCKDEKVLVTPTLAETHGQSPHRMLEGMPVAFAVLSLMAVLVGTIIELVPMLATTDVRDPSLYMQNGEHKIKPYTPLALAGRDIYIKEGCYVCHSQMIRPLKAEALRYGSPSTPEESIHDHPFQWGSKRTGPDLARLGQKYPDMWHYRHMINPRDIVPQSIMPEYSWLAVQKADFQSLTKKVSVMKMMGVPYSDDEVANAVESAQAEAKMISSELKASGAPMARDDSELVALIAYLQSLGRLSREGVNK